MENINPIILDGLKKYLDDDLGIPREIQDLVEKLLKVETISSPGNEGTAKIYEQILGKFIDNDKIVEWSEKYVRG